MKKLLSSKYDIPYFNKGTRLCQGVIFMNQAVIL